LYRVSLRGIGHPANAVTDRVCVGSIALA